MFKWLSNWFIKMLKHQPYVPWTPALRKVDVGISIFILSHKFCCSIIVLCSFRSHLVRFRHRRRTDKPQKPIECNLKCSFCGSLQWNEAATCERLFHSSKLQRHDNDDDRSIVWLTQSELLKVSNSDSFECWWRKAIKTNINSARYQRTGLRTLSGNNNCLDPLSLFGLLFNTSLSIKSN